MPQFALREGDLSAIYSCISGEGSVVTAMMLLSKPETTAWTPANVYDDCYLLTLTQEDLIELITHVSEESAAAEGFALIAQNLERGLLARGEDDDDDDDDDDDEDDEDDEDDDNDDDDDYDDDDDDDDDDGDGDGDGDGGDDDDGGGDDDDGDGDEHAEILRGG